LACEERGRIPTGADNLAATPKPPSNSTSLHWLRSPAPDLSSNQEADEFDCSVVEEVRVRLSDPGYVKYNSVGLFLKYIGMPEGRKKVRIWWDYANKGDSFQDIDLTNKEVRRVDDEKYDVELLVEHEYDEVRSEKQKRVRAELILAETSGNCARNRDIVLLPRATVHWSIPIQSHALNGFVLAPQYFQKVNLKYTTNMEVVLRYLITPVDGSIQTFHLEIGKMGVDLSHRFSDINGIADGQWHTARIQMSNYNGSWPLPDQAALVGFSPGYTIDWSANLKFVPE
jgi:hypothetical protein